VNALGDVLGEDGGVLAGARTPEGGFLGSDGHLLGEGDTHPQPGTNTTLAVVATDLPLSRVELGGLARMASGAFSRAISPVNTPFDGDAIFALSTGEGPSPLPPHELLGLGVAARTVLEEAVRRAVDGRLRA
ncbi:P1 family peptidase, partial [Gemmatimonadota bacterium]